MVAVAMASSIMFHSYKLHHNDLLMIGSTELSTPGNDSAMPTVRMTSPEPLVPVNLTNETLLVPFVPMSSLDSLWCASNAVVIRALSKIQLSIGTLTSITSRVTSRLEAAVKDVNTEIGQVMNTWYERSIPNFGINERAANTAEPDYKNFFMMFDIAITFVVIMLGVQLQYMYG